MIGYKLFKRRGDGSLGPLFINRLQRLEIGITYTAEDHPTKGYAHRPGWHICSEQNAPHRTKNGRVWALVEFSDYTEHKRPATQGGLWYTANKMNIVKVLE